MVTTHECIFTAGNHNIYTIGMALMASALGSVVNTDAEGARWSLKWQEMSCHISTLIIYIDYKHECIFIVGNNEIFMPALALCSVVNANAECAGRSPISSRYVPSGPSNDKKWAARHLLSLYTLTTNMSTILCLGMTIFTLSVWHHQCWHWVKWLMLMLMVQDGPLSDFKWAAGDLL